MKTMTLEHAYRKIRREDTEFFCLAPVPLEETCMQAGTDYDHQVMECEAMINQLKRMFPNPPEGIEFAIIENHHECGTYYEAAIFYAFNAEEESDPDTFVDHPATGYAQAVEAGLPENWDSEALAELKAGKHPYYFTAHKIKRTA